MKHLLIALLLLLFYKKSGCQLPANFDAYVDTVLATFNVPGACIAIVKDDKVVLAKGYGVKRMQAAEAVDAHTLFPIASNTKPFTAIALAVLVDEGKLHWDDAVIKYLPWFRMSDAWVTSQITIRDLLVHHCGIPAFAGDLLLFPPSTYSRKEIIEKLKDIPLVNSFRTTYAYDNILYVTAGEVISVASGMSYEDFIKTKIFDKIGMQETLVKFSDVKQAKNFAVGHTLLHNKLAPVTEFAEQDIGDISDAAGGIVSNANDMAKWLITELDSGKTIIKAKDVEQLWKVVTPIPVSKIDAALQPAQFNMNGYALGVRINNYGKYKLVGHGGNLDGFVSQVVLVPDLKLGIAILTNQQTTGAYWSIIYHLLDFYMSNPSFNWIKGYKQLLDTSMAAWQRDYDNAVVKPVAAAPKPAADNKYAGVYKNDFYGSLTITKTAVGLAFSYNETPLFKGSLEPFQYETFKAIFTNASLRGDGYMSFTLAPDGSVESCKLKTIDPDTNLSFDELIFKKEK